MLFYFSFPHILDPGDADVHEELAERVFEVVFRLFRIAPVGAAAAATAAADPGQIVLVRRRDDVLLDRLDVRPRLLDQHLRLDMLAAALLLFEADWRGRGVIEMLGAWAVLVAFILDAFCLCV